MSLINCNECGKEISDKAAACPHCGAPARPSACPKCSTQYITEQKAESASPVLFITVPMLLIGLYALAMVNWMVGLFILALAFLIDHFGRSKKTVLICPKCRYEPY